LAETRAGHRPAAQRAMIADAPAQLAADWLEGLAARLWRAAIDMPAPTPFHDSTGAHS